MKLLFIMLILMLPSSAISAEIDIHECANHPNKLTIESVGFEHVNHRIYLNETIFIKELLNEMWFIEHVQCIDGGFKLKASHIQYNVPDTKQFLLITSDGKSYSLTEE